ncbi:hypothetical protein CCAX7_64830 [Capsulimonas corticalis]|uniref:Uncharacterized protein n=1 Tax=Capsulimonas corticalis TaxID=2219043 RepID=A0A402CQX9_9BACT|nr:DUF2007 domain-containing protein [Capsulimonas corticalis]BDI34432.1 hypothetical protein CCAX7_64830 [Capsulimonas corticalis]
MIKVFTSPYIMDVEVVRGELESQGIATRLNHEFIRGQTNMAGFADIWPEVWVVNESDAPEAARIIARGKTPTEAPDWTCPQCGEEVEGQFTSCWNCGHDRPA